MNRRKARSYCGNNLTGEITLCVYLKYSCNYFNNFSPKEKKIWKNLGFVIQLMFFEMSIVLLIIISVIHRGCRLDIPQNLVFPSEKHWVEYLTCMVTIQFMFGICKATDS